MNQIKIYQIIVIYIIEIINNKYHNKALKYIKLNIYKIIWNNIFKIIKIKLWISLINL